MKRTILLTILILSAVIWVRAQGWYGWTVIHIGRVGVQEFESGSDMMSIASSGGSALVRAEESISRIVEEHCTEQPGECAALGITVAPLQ